MSKALRKNITLIIIWLIVIQAFLLGLKQAVFHFTEQTLFSRSMVTMAAMVLLLLASVLYCRKHNLSMSVFPERFGPVCIIVSALVFIFYIVTAIITKVDSTEKILMLLYGSLVTPLFEELLFRGVIWNKLNGYFAKEYVTYIVVTVLFALWHIGYAIGIYLWTGGNLLSCVCMKVLIGGIYGLITGAIRYKTKNCYLGILAHGVMNLFG